MGNRVEVEFIATDRGVVATAKGIADSLPVIERLARPASNELDALTKRIQELVGLTKTPLATGFLDELRGKGVEAVRAYHQELNQLAERQVNARSAASIATAQEQQLSREREIAAQKAKQLADANERLAQSIAAKQRAASAQGTDVASALAEAQGKRVRGPFGVSGLDTRTGSNALDARAQAQLPQSRFDFTRAVVEQRRFATETQRVTQLTDDQFKKMQQLDGAARRAHGGTEAVRSALLRVSGIPQSEAVGGLLQLGAAGTGPALAVAAVVAGVAVWLEKIISIRKENERLLKLAQEQAALTPKLLGTGGQGNLLLSERNEQTNKIRDFLRDLDKGRASGVSPDVITLNQKIIELTKGAAKNEDELRNKILRNLDLGQRQRELHDFLNGTVSDDNFVAQIDRRIRALPGGEVESFRRQLKGLRDEYISLSNAGERYVGTLDNIRSKSQTRINNQFDKDISSAKNPAQVDAALKNGIGNIAADFASRLQSRSIETAQGSKNREDIERELARVEERQRVLKEISEQSEQAKATFKQQDDQFKNTLQSARESIRQIGLEVQSSNPYVKIFSDAKESLRTFKESVKSLPGLVRDTKIEQFEKLLDQRTSQNVFKESLAHQDRLRSLLEEQAKIVAGLGGQANRDRFTERDAQRDAIIKEIEQKRGAGTLGKDEHFSLLGKLNALDNVSPLDRLEREFTARRIASDQAALASAGDDPLKQSLALDRLLSHTSDISKLSEDQVNVRTDALKRRIEIENAAQEKKDAQEAEKLATEKELIPALKEFTAGLLQGLGISVNVTDDAAKADLGTSPGADTLFGSASSFARGIGGGFTNNF
ncbi:MAG: hypothetical protein WBV94_05610 [Blastocatellia bacterium]